VKQPWWKKAFSYIDDLHIESCSSVHNEEVSVYLSKGEYQLVTPEAIYSYGLRYDNFFNAFKKIRIKDIAPKETLLLGLGLGSIPYMLEKHFKVESNYTAVEIDENIIYLASKYVLNDLKSDITTICTDALHFVNLDQNKYDFIAMDIFISDFIPPEFETIYFLENLKSLLSTDGIVLFNRLYLFDNDKRKTEEYFQNTFKKIFPEGRYFEINGNWILLNK